MLAPAASFICPPVNGCGSAGHRHLASSCTRSSLRASCRGRRAARRRARGTCARLRCWRRRCTRMLRRRRSAARSLSSRRRLAHRTRQGRVGLRGWRVGDLTLVDNRCAMHSAQPATAPETPAGRRLLWRLIVRGERPEGPAMRPAMRRVGTIARQLRTPVAGLIFQRCKSSKENTGAPGPKACSS